MRRRFLSSDGRIAPGSYVLLYFVAASISAVIVLPAADQSAGQRRSEQARAGELRAFDANRDIVSLHYDHAPDKDDGHSAAADRTMLQTHFDADWIKRHVVAVSGAYGRNKKTFNRASDRVMNAAFNDLGGWLAAHDEWDKAVAALVQRWGKTLSAGGDVWVKEGGQSDITAEVVRIIQEKLPNIDTARRIRVIQHGKWNEVQTHEDALAYVRKHTAYVRIRNANNYLNAKGGNERFEKAAVNHAVFGAAWRAAFEYYSPRHRLDFSDTGELMHILGVGEIGIDEFRRKYLDLKK
jgi:hypothetical protein